MRSRQSTTAHAKGGMMDSKSYADVLKPMCLMERHIGER